MTARWVFLIVATALVAVAMQLAGLPAPVLFGALVAGLAVALRWRRAPAVPARVFRVAQGVTGVTLGAYVDAASLDAVIDAWPPVIATAVATLLLSLSFGLLLARVTRLDRPTATLGMIAGGASGIVGMADELGADDRLVAFMQYLRVLVVVMLTPVLAAVGFGATGAAVARGEDLLGSAEGWLLTAAACAGGWLLARATRMTAGALIGPMAVAAALALALPGGFDVPALPREAAFAAIGLQVGLHFTLDSVRQAGRLVLPVTGCILALMAACFGLAAVLAATSHATLLDAYLATTPGGLFAILATAYGAGADTTFVVAVQTLRLFTMVLLAPVAVRLAARRDW